MAYDPNVKTTGSTPNDPAVRPAATSNPNHTDPAYNRPVHDEGSSWGKWAAIAAALVLGVFLLTSLFGTDEAGEEVATNTTAPVVVTQEAETVEAAPAAPVVTEEAEAPAVVETPAADAETDVQLVPIQPTE